MKTSDSNILFKKTFCLLSICVLGCFTSVSVHAQNVSQHAIPQATTVQAPVFSDAELDQMLAPIALYPDVLLTQTLIASTYPAEAIEAGNWLKANPNLRGKEAVDAASQTNWDDSIKSLAAFPEILVPMADYPDWTTGLGNAFLSQQQQLMNRVQFLRQKAKEQGNLQSNEQVRVQTTEQQTIVIEPATTQIVYVPYYNPTVVYGTWWWPAYTPVYWNPWPYAGYTMGYTSGFMWSGVGLWFSYTSWHPRYDWHLKHVYVVDRYDHRHDRRPPRREWSHRPEHRHDISYHDKTYKPGPNHSRPGLHGKPGKRPDGTPGGHHVPGRNDRPSADKNKRPASSGTSHMGLTDRNHNGGHPTPSKGKPFDIPRRNHTLSNTNRPANGHGTPVGQGMSGIRPVNPSGQGPSTGKPVNNSHPSYGTTNPLRVNRPGSHQSSGISANRQPGQSQSWNRPANSRPVPVPDTNRPWNNRPVTSPSANHSSDRKPADPTANRPALDRPAQVPSGNRPINTRPTNGQTVNRPGNNALTQGSVNRPSVNRPTSNAPAIGPTGNRPTAGSSANRPMPNRPVPNSPTSRSGIRPMPGQSSGRPAVNRPAPPVGRPSASRPVSASMNSRPSSNMSASRPSVGRSSAGFSPSRPAPSMSRPSGPDRQNHDRRHER